MNKAAQMSREDIPPSVCVPNNRPEVVSTRMVCDHICQWMMKMERTTINIIIMGNTMKKEEAGSRSGSFISHQASRFTIGTW